MIKKCVICGAEFTAPPSSKKITCSMDCSKIRKQQSHIGKHNSWTKESKRHFSDKMRLQGYTDNAKNALSVAMSLPESQRGENHRDAKVWVLISPDDITYRIINLTHWAREHAELFDTVTSNADRERIAHNIRTGFGNIVQTMSGRRKKPCMTYKGWRLGDWPRGKDETEDD